MAKRVLTEGVGMEPPHIIEVIEEIDLLSFGPMTHTPHDFRLLKVTEDARQSPPQGAPA